MNATATGTRSVAQRVEAAFKALKCTHDIVARSRFQCCDACAAWAMQEKYGHAFGVAWYDRAAARVLNRDGNLFADTALSVQFDGGWRRPGHVARRPRVAYAIGAALREQGLDAQWGGNPRDAINVTGIVTEEG